MQSEVVRSTSYRSKVTCDGSRNGMEDTWLEKMQKILIPDDDTIEHFLFISN